MKKKLLSAALVLCLLLTLLPMAAFAADDVQTGTCGDGLTWTLDTAGTLTVSGSGEISDYELESARGYLVSDLKIAMDSPGRLDDFYMGQILLESSATMQDLSDAIARVTKEEAAQAARALRLDTIYELQGVQA